MLLLVNKPLNFMGILTIGEVVTELGETVEPAETPMMLLFRLFLVLSCLI